MLVFGFASMKMKLKSPSAGHGSTNKKRCYGSLSVPALVTLSCVQEEDIYRMDQSSMLWPALVVCSNLEWWLEGSRLLSVSIPLDVVWPRLQGLPSMKTQSK